MGRRLRGGMTEEEVRAKCDGEIDFESLEPIDLDYAITVGKGKRCFDARALARLLQHNPDAVNPFSREMFTYSERKKIRDKSGMPVEGVPEFDYEETNEVYEPGAGHYLKMVLHFGDTDIYPSVTFQVDSLDSNVAYTWLRAYARKYGFKILGDYFGGRIEELSGPHREGRDVIRGSYDITEIDSSEAQGLRITRPYDGSAESEALVSRAQFFDPLVGHRITGGRRSRRRSVRRLSGRSRSGRTRSRRRSPKRS